MTKISRRLNHRVLLPLCGLLYFIGTITAEAATYYVSQHGNDSNSCAASQNIASSKLTFASAVPCLNPGDTLYIRAGTYTEQIDLQGPNKTGTAGNYITIAGYPGETVTIRYATAQENEYGAIKARGDRGYFIFENLILDGVNMGINTGWQIRDGNHDFVIRNVEIKNQAYMGLFLVNAYNITVQNSRFHDNRHHFSKDYAMYISTGVSNVLVEGNDFYNHQGGGIHVYPGNAVSGLTIRSNKIHDNCLYLDVKTGHAFGGIIVGGSWSNVQIYNNLIYNNGALLTSSTQGAGHGIATYTSSYGTPSGLKVWNNTVYGNKGYGILLVSGTSSAVVQNNIVYGNTPGSISDAGTGSMIDHNLTTDPRFMNAAALDFNLQTTSPAINAGVMLSQVPTDFKKTQRPQGFTHDIGAYEVGTASASAPPSPPRNLSVR